MNKFKGYIYLIKNIYNNKIYIGQSLHPEIRLYKHFDVASKKPKFYIHQAIHKYGRHNFRLQILGECFSKQELNEAERECISFFESNDRRYGYNLTEGGEGCVGYKHSIETRNKISKAKSGKVSNRKGCKLSNEIKQKISESHKGKPSPRKGSKLSYETKKRMSKSHIGKKMSIGMKQKMSKLKTGTILSDEHKIKISNGLKKHYKRENNEIK